MPSVFFSRCKPRGFDAIDIVLQHNVAFVGWPVSLGIPFNRHHVHECILDLDAPDDAWWPTLDHLHLDRTQRRMANLNRNLAQEIEHDSILLVPRPKRGVIYAGRVQGHFQLVNNPEWIDDYLHLIEDHVSPEEHEEHLSEVVQCWRVDRFRPVPVPAIPAWIRRSLFGRSTLGRIRRVNDATPEPFDMLNEIIDHPGRIVRPWTIDPAEIKCRLITDIGPNAFEHLSVALLQLEHHEEVWTHVGGSGDGGVDGIGSNDLGEVCGILQCKWAYRGEDLGLEAVEKRRIVLTSLLHHPDVQVQEGIDFIGLSEIARLVLQHAAHLPQARSLRIGQP